MMKPSPSLSLLQWRLVKLKAPEFAKSSWRPTQIASCLIPWILTRRVWFSVQSMATIQYQQLHTGWTASRWFLMKRVIVSNRGITLYSLLSWSAEVQSTVQSIFWMTRNLGKLPIKSYKPKVLKTGFISTLMLKRWVGTIEVSQMANRELWSCTS